MPKTKSKTTSQKISTLIKLTEINPKQLASYADIPYSTLLYCLDNNKWTVSQINKIKKAFYKSSYEDLIGEND